MVDSLDRAQKQELLRTLWLEAKSGALTAREQAKAWALREAWRDSGKTEHGMCTYIAGKLTKTDGAAPKSESVKKLLDKMDADDDWFPGKAHYENMGPSAALTKTNRAAIAKSAMALKKKGVEPTYGRVVAACPKAAVNPVTKNLSRNSQFIPFLQMSAMTRTRACPGSTSSDIQRQLCPVTCGKSGRSLQNWFARGRTTIRGITTIWCGRTSAARSYPRARRRRTKWPLPERGRKDGRAPGPNYLLRTCPEILQACTRIPGTPCASGGFQCCAGGNCTWIVSTATFPAKRRRGQYISLTRSERRSMFGSRMRRRSLTLYSQIGGEGST